MIVMNDDGTCALKAKEPTATLTRDHRIYPVVNLARGAVMFAHVVMFLSCLGADMLSWRGSFLLVMLFVVSACSGREEVEAACSTGELLICTCDDGSPGSKFCDADGSFSACSCEQPDMRADSAAFDMSPPREAMDMRPVSRDMRPDLCGNMIVDDGEDCDEGTRPPTRCPYSAPECMVCSTACELVAGEPGPFCGDGVLQRHFGEVCEPGQDPTDDRCDYGQASCEVCDEFCTPRPGVPVGYCGDGEVQRDFEGCDHGGQPDDAACPDGDRSCQVCNQDCQLEYGLEVYPELGRGCSTDAQCGDGVCLLGYFDRGMCSRRCEDRGCTTDSACVELIADQLWCSPLCGDGSVTPTGGCPLDEPEDRLDVTCSIKSTKQNQAKRVCTST